MKLNSGLKLTFDYLICSERNVVLDLEFGKNGSCPACLEKGNDCILVGQNYQIKKRPVKLSNDISSKIIKHYKEQQNIRRHEARHAAKLRRRKREQDNYHNQIKVGESVLNLEVVQIAES